MRLIAEEERRRARPEIEKLRGGSYWSDYIVNKNHSTAKHSFELQNITMSFCNHKLKLVNKKVKAQLIKVQQNNGKHFLPAFIVFKLFTFFFKMIKNKFKKMNKHTVILETEEKNVSHCLGAIK